MIDKQEIVYRSAGSPRIELHRGIATLPSGLTYTAHWMITGEGRPGVVVCAVHEGRLLFVNSPRPTLNATLLELPRGFGEPDSASPIDDAARELQEETGYTGKSFQVVAEYVTDSSVLPARVVVVLCGVDLSQPIKETDGETSGVEWVELDRIFGLIAEGALRDAHTLSGLAAIAPIWATGAVGDLVVST